ncbi:MAG TPA: WhiB family transcriptional regulator [Acidimicrobiia bacterium]|nr:WhiB family transcriptional regulator [Acidimicrobiia bacterium]
MLSVTVVLERVWRNEEVGALAQWRTMGNCRGSDPAIFYPPSEEDTDAAEAKMICVTCPVRQPCLEFALSTREKHGVWGGLTERERRRLLRQRRKTA